MTRREWAERFKANPKCDKCPFITGREKTSEGEILHCDAVCEWDVDDITEELKRTEATA